MMWDSKILLMKKMTATMRTNSMQNRKRRKKKTIAHRNGSRREAEAGVRLLGNHPPAEPVDTTPRTMTTILILHHADRLIEDLPQEGDEVVVAVDLAGDLVVEWLLSQDRRRLRLLGA